MVRRSAYAHRPTPQEALKVQDLSVLDAAQPGDVVMARAWKYDGYPHYAVPYHYLGKDESGHWLGHPPGYWVSRPLLGFKAASEALLLVPAEGFWLASFYPREGERAVDWWAYIDLSARIGVQGLPPRPGSCRNFEVNSIDMDLDVIRSTSQGVFIDDEDEFAEHRHELGYPDEVVRQMKDTAESLVEMLHRGQGPLGTRVVDEWFVRAKSLWRDQDGLASEASSSDGETG